jgi:hypothetical protein
LEGDLKEIYNLVRSKVKLVTETGKFTARHIRPLVVTITEVVEEFTEGKYDHISGEDKQEMAINILIYDHIYLP